MKLERRIEIEKILREALVDLLLKEGYEVGANNGEDRIPFCKDADKIKNYLGAVDEEHINTRKDGNVSFVFLVYGNSGWDLFADYGVSLEPVMAQMEPMQDQFEKEYNQEDAT